MEIGSFVYRSDLTRTWVYHEKGIAFLDGIPLIKLRIHFQSVIEDIHTQDDGDYVNLEAFLATHNTLEMFLEDPPSGLSLVIFPKSGRIQKYELKKEGDFFTNCHRDPDPLVIKDIKKGLFLTKKTEDFIWFPGRVHAVPNQIQGIVLFKQNLLTPITKYPGFAEYLEYDPRRRDTYKDHNY